MTGIVTAGISTIVRKDKFIYAEGIAPEAFITYRALTYTAITGTLIKAEYIVALVFIACCIGNGSKADGNEKGGKQYQAHVFHKQNLRANISNVWPKITFERQICIQLFFVAATCLVTILSLYRRS
jgi:hypothetical protein